MKAKNPFHNLPISHKLCGILLLVGLMMSGCGRFDVEVEVKAAATPVLAAIAVTPATSTPFPTEPAATATELPIPSPSPSPTAQSVSSPFEPYPVISTDVEAIQINNDTEMTSIYSGPGQHFPLAATVRGRFAFAVSGITEDGRWYQLAGCSQQNPFRPAPTCWISTDPGVVEPISPIVSSQAPVQPTNMKAVSIMTSDMAPVYVAPDASSALIAYLAGGFSFSINGMSEDGHFWRLEECSSPLNERLTDCWISADPAITLALDESIPHGPQSSAPATNDTPVGSGITTIIELPRCFNLDTGTVGSRSNPNCEFNLLPSESPDTLFFEPIQPARFGFGGVFPEPPTEAMCAGSQHLSGTGEVIAPVASFYVCYQTGQGRFGYLRFWEMTNSPLTVTMEWKTFGQ